ncbi:MAG TPA: hypothetical protein DIS94_05105 [Bacteroidetes bacterium]|nr:hypothetical protein [Bacteroidota bacterium]
MENITVFKLLKAFSKEELNSIGKYINSPAFNNRKEVAKYYEVIKKNFNELKSGKLTQQTLYKSLYPAKTYSEKKSGEELKKLNSFLLQVINKYLAYTGLQADDFFLKQALVIKLNEKGLFPLGKKYLNQLDEEYKTVKSDAANFFWKKFQIEQDKASGYTYSGEDHLASVALQKRARYFIHHTILTSSSVYINLFINEQNFNADSSISGYYDFFDSLNFEKEILKMEKSKDEFYYVTAIYFYQAMSLRYLNEKKYFEKYKILLSEYGDRFTYIDRINFYSILQAICTLKIESGLKEYEIELFIAYNEMLKKDLISINEGGYFMIKLYRNFIQTGVLLKKFDWIRELIKKYSNRFPPESKENMIRFADALILFEENKFEKSLEKVSLIDYEIFHFKIDLKILQLRNFIELNLINESYSIIDSLKHFIVNNKFISGRYREKLKKFLNVILKFINLKEKQNKIELDLLSKEIKNSGDVLYKDWIVKKIKEAK